MSNTRKTDFFQELQDHGYTQNIRTRYRDHAHFYESGFILKAIGIQEWKLKFGSFVEATELPGRNSDMDMMTVLAKVVAIDGRTPCNLQLKDKSENERVIIVEMVSDEWTRPGLTKIVPCNLFSSESIQCYNIKTARDVYGREVVCFSRNLFYSTHLPQYVHYSNGPYRLDMSGPAVTLISENARHLDFILALVCRNWPLCAQFWLRRQKTLIWLGENEMQKLANMQCFLVPTGYHESNLEWRISFSLQERELFWKLNDVQYKCFILMKYIKQACFVSGQKNKARSLTSYHCKTALFYTVENNPNIWSRENLIECTSVCFRLLLIWVINKHCPSYFVPEVNLFSKLSVSDLEYIRDILEDLLSYPVSHLTKGMKRMVNLHQQAPEIPFPAMQCVDKSYYQSIKLMHSLDHTHREIGSLLGDIFGHTLNYSLDDAISYFARILLLKVEDCEMIQTLIFPCIHTSLACHIVIKAMRANTMWARNFFILSSAFHFCKGLKSDRLSSKLKFATVLLYTGHKNSASAILEEMSRESTRSLLFGCSCVYESTFLPYRLSYFYNMNPVNRKHFESLSTIKLIQEHMFHCVTFLPTEIEIVPYPLRFEMFRSVGVPHDAEVKSIMHLWWFRCSVMHPESYMHFLRYFTGASRMGIPHGLPEETTTRTWQHYHTETKMNVSGWLVERGGHYIEAFSMYVSSWQYLETKQVNYPIFPKNKSGLYLHNAAKWLIVLLLYQRWCSLRDFKTTKYKCPSI